MKKCIFEIFRTGKHNGKNSNRTWNEQDLKNIALMYSENILNAPLVIGHPKNNSPKFGNVKRVIYCKNSLFAEAEISTKLINKIENGEISGISASFIHINNPQNPVKGASYYLNHVGFLEQGKDNPAVKNMLPPEISVQSLYFNEQESEVLLFCEDETQNKAEILHNKTLYIKQVLDVDYCTAFNLINH